MKRLLETKVFVLHAHLIAFCLAAGVAFHHNIGGLFDGYDGSYMLVDALTQRHSWRDLFDLSSNFGQSIGSIQLTVIVKLFPFYWPLFMFDSLVAAKIAVYLLISSAMFIATFSTARLFSTSFGAALTAGWIIGVVATPMIQRPVFNPIFWIAPQSVLILATPPLVFGLMQRIGQRGVATDALCCAGLVGMAFYILVAAPAQTLLIAPSLVPYVVASLWLSRPRSQFFRKMLVISVVIAVALALRWPWYLFGLFAYTAAYLYGQDFTPFYTDPSQISVLFQNWIVGPALVACAVGGALASCRSPNRNLRVGAWMVLLIVAGILALRVAFAIYLHSFRLSPLYFEIAFWPLYATYAAVAIVRVGGVVADIGPRLRISRSTVVVLRFVLPTAFAALAIVRLGASPVSMPFPFPPTRPPIVDMLANQTSIKDGARFEGRVATFFSVDAAGSAWYQQYDQAVRLANETGNDHFSLGLWWFRIPTLFQYNQFSSPAMHALGRLSLEKFPISQERNVTIYTRPNVRILQMLGIRYVIMPSSSGRTGIERQTESVAGETLRLSELEAPNLGTYTPTVIEHQANTGAAINRVAEDDFDPKTTAVASDDVSGPLVPTGQAALYFSGEDLRIVATSVGRTLIVVPREFSRCLELQKVTAGSPSLHRIDGLLTGVLFERQVDAVLAFRTGPLHRPTCRYQDYREFAR
jgi:hypothetical protein